MVLPIDEHYDVTTDVSSEVVYDARSRQKLDKNDVDARLNEPEDFEDDDEWSILFLLKKIILFSRLTRCRTPFDFSEGKKELVYGFNVEYREGGNILFTLVAGCSDCCRGLGCCK